MNQSFIRLSSPASSSFAGITRAVIARLAGFVIAAIGRSSFACVAFFAANATPRIPYANDFSTRTSGATPSGRWMETSYIPGALVRPVSSAGDAYNSATAYQDGWTMKAGLAHSTVTFTVTDDGGNQAVLVNSSSASVITDGTVAMQPFYNEFTDGVLKISADIRTPASTAFNIGSDAYAAIIPLYKSALDVAGSTLSTSTRIGMGNVYNDGARYVRASALVMNIAGTGAAINGASESQNDLTAVNWYRYEAVIDIAAGTFTATFGNLGASHPTPDTVPSSVTDFRRFVDGAWTTTLPLRNAPTSETGGFAGVALYVLGFKEAAAADAPMFDNIAVSWTAPGAEDFAPVYSNDFTTRRYRQIEPAGATSGAYALAPTTNTVQSAYYERGSSDGVHALNESSTRKLVPNYVSGGPYVGQDGWRRLDGSLYFTLVDPNKTTTYGWENATVLRATSSANNGASGTARGAIAAPLGTSLTTDKVRLYFDIMAPYRWYAPSDASQNYCGVYLGSAAETAPTASTAINTLLDGKGAFGGGIFNSPGASGNNNTYRWIYTANAQFMGGQISDIGAPYYCRWYRFKATADLDSKTYDIEAYFIGATGLAMGDTSMFAEDKVRLRQNKSFHGNAPAAIDTVFIALQSAAKYNTTGTRDSLTYSCYPLFDNVRVCRVNDDGTDGADIYACNFEYGYRTTVRDVAVLAGDTDREGADRWIRRGRNVGSMSVIDAGGGDGVVSMTDISRTSGNRSMFAVQPFGSASKNCASVDFSADIRPPAFFSAEGSSTTTSSGYAYVEVGGDNYYQGVYCPASDNNWRSEPRIGFGFTAISGKDACQQFTNIVFSVRTRTSSATTTTNSTTAIDKSHWYRFRMKAHPTNAGGKFTVKVYDQGATKPAASDADGTLVETFENLTLPAFPEPGMTTFGLAASNFSGTRGGGIDDPNVALVDNLKVDFAPTAFMIIVR